MNQVNEDKNLGGEGTESLVSREHGSLVGRELDREIAERVFGIKKIFYPRDYKSGNDVWGSVNDPHFIPSGKPPRTHMIDAKPVPHFSTYIAAVWAIVEHFQRQGYMVSVNASSDNGQWWCVMYPPVGMYSETEYCASAQEAICRAALHAVSTQVASEQKG